MKSRWRLWSREASSGHWPAAQESREPTRLREPRSGQALGTRHGVPMPPKRNQKRVKSFKDRDMTFSAAWKWERVPAAAWVVERVRG